MLSYDVLYVENRWWYDIKGIAAEINPRKWEKHIDEFPWQSSPHTVPVVNPPDQRISTPFLALCEGNTPVTNGVPLTKVWYCGALVVYLLLVRKAVEQTLEFLIIWGSVMLMWRHWNMYFTFFLFA